MRSIRRRTAPWPWQALRTRRSDRDREGGQAIVMFALVMVVILATASLVIDVGMLRNDRQTLINALDAGALAGGADLPVDGSVSGAQAALETLIKTTISADYPGIQDSQYTIAYRCLVGVTDSNAPDLTQIPANCDPTHALGHTPVAGDFTGAGDRRSSNCDPSLGDKCNTVVVTGAVSQQYGFGPIVGVDSGSTGAVQSASCNGPCGAVINTPVDVVLIIDRTSSMSGTDTDNAKDAANSVVDLYSAKNGLVQLSLSALGPSDTPPGTCVTKPDNSIGKVQGLTYLSRWVPIPLTGTAAGFKSIGGTSGGSNSAIKCYANSSTGTDLADPIYAAAEELTKDGRAGAVQGIILETDGQPNAAASDTPYPISQSKYCAATIAAADAAKAKGIIIYTVGFGLDGSNDAKCEDTSGTWKGKTATAMLAAASGTSSVTSDDNGCTANGPENSDGDYFFCVPKTKGASTDLSSVFDAAAQSLAQTGPTLISLYPPPIVTNVGTPATAGAFVTVTGKYLSGATSVTFGGAQSPSINVTSDTSINAQVPNGSGTVQVLVTTPGGTSYQDVEFTYSP